jgi:cytochrome P450
LDADIDSKIKDAINEFSFIVSIFFMMPWVPRWFWKVFLKWNSKYQRAYQVFYKFIEEGFEQERENRSKMKNQRSKSFIGSLVLSLSEETDVEQMSSGLTRSEIFDDAFLLMTTGSGTTTAAVAWFIFFASKNPLVQERMKDELRQYNLLMSNDLEGARPLTEENLSSLIYCECVVKEVGSI